jgi:hypothetical protein
VRNPPTGTSFKLSVGWMKTLLYYFSEHLTIMISWMHLPHYILFVRSPCKISYPFDNPFREKINPRRRREREEKKCC